MAEIGEEPWVPPRPPSYSSAWGDSDQPIPPLSDLPLPPRDPPHRAGARTRRGRVSSRWSRASLGRRILLSYAALAGAILLVVTIGGALQPSYGSLTPWQGIRVDDIRSAPRSGAWAVDLAAMIAPGAPPECIRFSAVDVGQDLAAIRADNASAYGFSDDSVCSVVPAGFRSRVVLLDTATGAVRWIHDVADELPSGEGVSVTWMSTVDHESRLVIHATTSSQSVIESLSLGSGQVMESTGPLPWSQDGRFTASGRVVATGSLSFDDLSYTYTLRDADDLSKIVWQGTGNENSTMIALSDRLLLGDRGTVQVPLATGIASRWGGPVNTTLGYAVHDDVVYADAVRGQGVTTTAGSGFTAVDRTGHILWRSSLDLRGNYSLTRSCLAVTDRKGDTLSCLDYLTGEVLWTSDVGPYSFAGSAPGQRTDDLFAVSMAGRARLVDLDGRNGHVRYTAAVPPGASLVASGLTVAYVLAYGAYGSSSSVVAYDASSGRRLWCRSSQVQVGIWGGHLIDIGLDGLARRLDE